MKKLLQNVIVFFSLTLYTVSSAQPPPISASFSPSVVHDPTYFGLNGANVWENSAGYIAVDNLLLPIKVKHVRHIGGAYSEFFNWQTGLPLLTGELLY